MEIDVKISEELVTTLATVQKWKDSGALAGKEAAAVTEALVLVLRNAVPGSAGQRYVDGDIVVGQLAQKIAATIHAAE